MKVTKNELKAIINEELQAELNEGMLDKLADKIFNWLTGTTAGKKTLERANAHNTRMRRSGASSAYRPIPK